MRFDHPLLTRRPWHGAPALSLGEGAGLRLGRLHEACGNARQSFALMVAARVLGQADARADPAAPLYWVSPHPLPERLNPHGMAELVNPGRAIFVTPDKDSEALWVLEEILRAGAVPLAVAELTRLPDLVQVRRLHLAAETGAGRGHGAPLGLILTPGDGGAPGIESRWHMAQAHADADTARSWLLERRRDRGEPPRSWRVHPAPGGGRLTPLTEAPTPPQAPALQQP